MIRPRERLGQQDPVPNLSSLNDVPETIPLIPLHISDTDRSGCVTASRLMTELRKPKY